MTMPKVLSAIILWHLKEGDLQSAYNVGVCYGRGYGVDADPDEAFRYYMVAAEEVMPMRSSR